MNSQIVNHISSRNTMLLAQTKKKNTGTWKRSSKTSQVENAKNDNAIHTYLTRVHMLYDMYIILKGKNHCSFFFCGKQLWLRHYIVVGHRHLKKLYHDDVSTIPPDCTHCSLFSGWKAVVSPHIFSLWMLLCNTNCAVYIHLTDTHWVILHNAL